MTDGVVEGDVAGVEADAAVGVRAGGAVFEVAFDGAADGGELAADLMMAAGEELDFDQMVTVGIAEDAIAELCELRVGRMATAVIGESERFVLLLVAGEPVDEFALGGVGRAQVRAQ